MRSTLSEAARKFRERATKRNKTASTPAPAPARTMGKQQDPTTPKSPFTRRRLVGKSARGSPLVEARKGQPSPPKSHDKTATAARNAGAQSSKEAGPGDDVPGRRPQPDRVPRPARREAPPRAGAADVRGLDLAALGVGLGDAHAARAVRRPHELRARRRVAQLRQEVGVDVDEQPVDEVVHRGSFEARPSRGRAAASRRRGAFRRGPATGDGAGFCPTAAARRTEE